VTNFEAETLDLESSEVGSDVRPSCCVGEVLSGRYRLDEEIGRGGMGIVFRAWDVELERAVAVKVIGAELEAGEGRERLFREARAAAALSHPNVVAVYDVGEHDEMPYFVMELIEGRSLSESAPEKIDEILGFAVQICGALSHAHEHGLVHRDLKPANVLIEWSHGVPAIKIVDLGLAIRERGMRITRQGGIAGTVSYMSPEQALGGVVDGRSDLYSLGVMLYELVTGRLPFDGDNALAVLSQHIHAPVVPPRTYRGDVPVHVEAAILRLLSKDPDDRYATAADTAVALTSFSERVAPSQVASAALGGLVRGRMVGREAEFETLRRSWCEAGAGRGGMVLVSGEPGSGKTRLARELMDYARITGGTVVSGGCYELEAATPYLPFVEAIRSWVHQSTNDEIRNVIGDSGAELARLAPELASRIGPFAEVPELSASEERLRLFDGISRFFFSLAGEGGLLLFVDDLQWADQASLSLLHYLVRIIGTERVLILGCYRETELDRAHPLAEALDNWNRERAAVRIHLRRLELEATAAMLTVLLGDECLTESFCEDIHRETEGNPFFVEEVVKTLVEENQIVCDCGEWRRRDQGALLVLPQGVKAAIGRRLDRVSRPTTDILRTAAILGKNFNYAELAAVADANEEELLDALDEAVAAQLLETGVGDAVAFTHDKIREVLYHELNPIRRRRLHTRIADGLEALRESGGRVAVEDLAHHYIEGGGLDKGYGYVMTAAADATRIFAYTDAIRLYERARECVEALDRHDQLPEIDATMGRVATLMGDPLVAAEHYERALAATEDDADALKLRCKIGEAYVLIGDARALEYVKEVKAALDREAQPGEFARVMMIEGRFHHYHGRSREAATRLHQALEPAENSGDTNLLGWILGYLAGAYQHLTEFEESNRWAQRAVDLGREVDSPGVEAIGHEFKMENAFMRGRWAECLEHADRHRILAEKSSSFDRLAWNCVGPTFARLGMGELERSIAAADAGLDLADRLGDIRLAIFLGCWRAQAIAELGRIDKAKEYAENWLRIADDLGLKSGRFEGRRVMAVIAQLAGDDDRCLEFIAQADELLEGTDEAIHPAWTMPLACRSLVAVGRLDEAESKIGDSLDATRRGDMPHWEALTIRARAGLYAARGDFDAAGQDLDAAVAIFERIESRLELGRTLVLRGSVEDIERARELFERCGAVGDLTKLAEQQGKA
jgi:tetratricopeptide (TPR) repeat protein